MKSMAYLFALELMVVGVGMILAGGYIFYCTWTGS